MIDYEVINGKYILKGIFVANELKDKRIPNHMKSTFAYVKCDLCGKVGLININNVAKCGHHICKSCSLKQKSKQALDTRKQTCLKKYGVENVFQDKSIKNKIKQTCKEKYGVEFAAQSADVVEKQKLTKRKWTEEERDSHLSHYKEAWCNRTDEEKQIINEKRKLTCLEKYGSLCSLQNEQVAKKTTSTINKLYGSNYISQSDYWHEKKIEVTKQKRYEILKIKDFSKFNLTKIDDGTEIKAKCNVCGTEFNVDSVYTKSLACPKCHPYGWAKSHKEKLIADFLKSYNIKVVENDRTEIKPLELDIFCSDFNIALEFDGDYWHSTKVKQDSNYHINKTELCEKKGIRLVHIFENEFEREPDLVFSVIKSIFNIEQKKVFARKCIVQEIDSNTYAAFCNANHLQGYAAATIKLGLFYNNELVEVESYSKSRFSKKYEWEMIRECSKCDYQILGGKAKLLKYFIKKYDPKSIISYCDRRWFNGKSYLACGFAFKENTKPSYNYIYKGSLLTRYQCQKHKLNKLLGEKYNSSLTEKDNMLINGALIIYDCGQKVFVWQK